MSVILNRVDTPPIEGVILPEDLKRWMTNLVDEINYNLQLIEDELTSIDARLTAGGL
jgi:hypothetical protein